MGTPFGIPVVPEVNIIYASSSSATFFGFKSISVSISSEILMVCKPSIEFILESRTVVISACEIIFLFLCTGLFVLSGT